MWIVGHKLRHKARQDDVSGGMFGTNTDFVLAFSHIHLIGRALKVVVNAQPRYPERQSDVEMWIDPRRLIATSPRATEQTKPIRVRASHWLVDYLRNYTTLFHICLTEEDYTATAFRAFVKSANSAFVSCSLVALEFPRTSSSVRTLIPGRNSSGFAVAASHIFRAA
jgi:hypothetical protein